MRWPVYASEAAPGYCGRRSPAKAALSAGWHQPGKRRRPTRARQRWRINRLSTRVGFVCLVRLLLSLISTQL